MQTFRDKPILVVGLLIVAIAAVAASWLITMRPSEPQAPTYTPPQQQSNPDRGQLL